MGGADIWAALVRRLGLISAFKYVNGVNAGYFGLRIGGHTALGAGLRQVGTPVVPNGAGGERAGFRARGGRRFSGLNSLKSW